MARKLNKVVYKKSEMNPLCVMKGYHIQLEWVSQDRCYCGDADHLGQRPRCGSCKRWVGGLFCGDSVRPKLKSWYITKEADIVDCSSVKRVLKMSMENKLPKKNQLGGL